MTTTSAISVADVLQLLAAVVSALVIVNALLTQVREWRLGSPELRLLRSALETVQGSHTALLQKILEKVG